MRKFKDSLRKIFICPTQTILQAIQMLNDTASQILLVVGEEDRLTGTLTDGDIRKAISDGKALDTPICLVCNMSPKTLFNRSYEEALSLMNQYGFSRVPILDENGVPIDIICMEDILPGQLVHQKRLNKVVIMAGGRGSRLDPITRIIPKPLLPIGDKPILELIMESFVKCGFSDFLISVNYRKDFIKTWLAERSDLPFSVTCVEEGTFLGTAGSLALMKEFLKETFFVSNCDILVDVNYTSALEFHRENGYAFTVVGALKKVNVPYG
ncbi:MAG: CBS domain-containing protein, partial [Synergistaceae bacterium]|nr:CBS domain-containing protein [Synergistaceae bacterium]